MTNRAFLVSALTLCAFACTTPADCSLGGTCVASVCVCRPAWRGANCSQLALSPARSGLAFHESNTSSWGGSVVRVGSQFWMAVAEMEGHCGLSSWESNSAIRLAVSRAGPEGPFERAQILLPPFAHNPTMHATRNGSLLIAHIGTGVAYHPPISNCTNGTTPGARPGARAASPPAPPPRLVLGVKGAPLPPPNFLHLPSGDPGDGSPWVVLNSSGGAWADNNPALIIGADDSALLVYKTHCACPGGCFCAQFGVASAPHYGGPYTDGGLINVFGEDAYVWRDAVADGAAFHMLFQGGSYAPEYPQYTGHWHTAFSPDFLQWTVAAESMVFDGNISLAGGGSLALGRRERHQVLFDESGAPQYLYNGAMLSNATGDGTFTSVQPIGG